MKNMNTTGHNKLLMRF